MIAAESPERVFGGGNAFELDPEIGNFAPFERISFEAEQPAWRIDAEENFVRFHSGTELALSKDKFKTPTWQVGPDDNTEEGWQIVTCVSLKAVFN